MYHQFIDLEENSIYAHNKLFNSIEKRIRSLKERVINQKENCILSSGLSDDEEESIRWKTGRTMYINFRLRQGAEINEKYFEQDQITHIQNLDTAIQKSCINRNILLYRNVLSGYFLQDYGKFRIGSIIVDKGYMETSLVRTHTMIDAGANVQLKIIAPKNTNAIYVPEYNPDKEYEYGVLFPRNTRIRIIMKRPSFLSLFPIISKFSKYDWIIYGKIIRTTIHLGENI